MHSSAQDVPPLVYDVEFTAADCTKPPLPTMAELPVIKPLTDPFEWSDGSGRDTTFAAWTHRRAEIKAEIENYEIGLKPDRPDSIYASYADSILTVQVIKNGDTLTLTSKIVLPEGEGPFPAIIGMTLFQGLGGSGSLPADIFTSRNIATIEFVHDQVTTYANSFTGATPSISDPFFRLYPDHDLENTGQYSAWAWGVSRLIDGLEFVQGDLPIDLKRLAVTGCSYAGKMALFAGAFDERVALTIAQESGGGGAPAWRVSETLGNVETLGATSRDWFRTSMFRFAGENTARLPHDHHELMAMCAPRALLVTGNTDFGWLANPSCYISASATKKVFNTFDIGDRFGFYIDGGHNHCAVPESQRPAIEAFVDRFLLGDTTVNTNIATHPYPGIVPEYWTDWWGTGEPDFANLDRGDVEEYWFEAECVASGAVWNVRLDTLASNESYIVPKSGLNSLSTPSADTEAYVYFPFTVKTDTTFYVFGRVNCLKPEDSYWLKLDDGDFKQILALGSEGWEWKNFTAFEFAAGEHTLTLSYREKSVRLDKLCISAFQYPPAKLGETAQNVCVPDTTTRFYADLDIIDVSGSYMLGQNYPNPVTNSTTIGFEIPQSTYVSLKVYSVLGEEIAELAGKVYTAGRHNLEFNTRNLSNGIYLYTFQADNYLTSRKMMVITD